MSNTSLTLLVLTVLLILLPISFFYVRRTNRAAIKTIINPSIKVSSRKQESNPDINTNNWDLHKLRLVKFRRSQYKGLTFFLSSEDKIYYLSAKGDKVYC